MLMNFLEQQLFKANLVCVKFQQFSDSKTLLSVRIKFPPKRCCCLCKVYEVLVWSILICQEREFEQTILSGHKGTLKITGHCTFYLGFITRRLNHLSKLCEVSPFRYAHSCILYGIFGWEYESVQLDIKEWFLDGLGPLNSLYSALAFW